MQTLSAEVDIISVTGLFIIGEKITAIYVLTVHFRRYLLQSSQNRLADLLVLLSPIGHKAAANKG